MERIRQRCHMPVTQGTGHVDAGYYEGLVVFFCLKEISKTTGFISGGLCYSNSVPWLYLVALFQNSCR